MADDNKTQSSDKPATHNTGRQAYVDEKKEAEKKESSEGGTVHVELLAKMWQEPQADGSWIRHRQGAILDIPEKLYQDLAVDHFKPAFREVSKDA